MAEINVTPLVDVMLVLLIIFMVTAPLLVAGVPVDLPESRANALTQESNQVTLAIDGQGQVFLDDAPIAPGELPERIDALGCIGRGLRQRFGRGGFGRDFLGQADGHPLGRGLKRAARRGQRQPRDQPGVQRDRDSRPIRSSRVIRSGGAVRAAIALTAMARAMNHW